MFESLTNQQKLGDQILNLVDQPAAGRTPSERAGKPAVLDTIILFERAAWHPGVFTDAVNESAPGMFSESENGKLDYHGQPADIYGTVSAVLLRYLVLIEALQKPVEQEYFSTQEAAAYLEIPVRTLNHHIHTSKKLRGELVGKSLIFTRKTLDEFRAVKEGLLPGRPPKNPA